MVLQDPDNRKRVIGGLLVNHLTYTQKQSIS